MYEAKLKAATSTLRLLAAKVSGWKVGHVVYLETTGDSSQAIGKITVDTPDAKELVENELLRPLSWSKVPDKADVGESRA